MIPMTLAEIAAVVGGRVTGGHEDVRVTGPASVDSRAVDPGGLFVAVVGAKADGHDFAPGAVAGGAAAYLGSRDLPVPGVVVPEPVPALGLLARHLIDSVPDLTVLALTGSQGKTGTKDYLAQVLEGAGPTVATAGNHNNELGVPLTVLRADPSTRYLVVEMGARGVGHVAQLCRIVPPRVAAVLNVGTAHVGEFGSQDAIARAKGEIVEALPESGTAVLNAADPLVAAMAARTPAAVLTFGPDADVAWDGLTLDDLGRPSFALHRSGRRVPVRLTQSGAHQVVNAAAAAAMALAVGLDLEAVGASLSASRPRSQWRMEVTTRADGLVVVNDSYNANPASMAAALDALGAIGARREGRTVAVLGEMKELGGQSREGHLEVGRYAAATGTDVVLTVGEAAAAIAEGADADPRWTGESVLVPTRDEALRWIRENGSAADTVLVKASRGAALEHLARALMEEGETPA